jgi:hypothetical protein
MQTKILQFIETISIHLATFYICQDQNSLSSFYLLLSKLKKWNEDNWIDWINRNSFFVLFIRTRIINEELQNKNSP